MAGTLCCYRDNCVLCKRGGSFCPVCGDDLYVELICTLYVEMVCILCVEVVCIFCVEVVCIMCVEVVCFFCM